MRPLSSDEVAQAAREFAASPGTEFAYGALRWLGVAAGFAGSAAISRDLDTALAAGGLLVESSSSYEDFLFEAEEKATGMALAAAMIGVSRPVLASEQTGELGERITKRILRSRGYTNIVSLQASGGQGLDVAAVNRHGQILVFEVKTRSGGSAGDLELEQRNAPEYIRDRLNRIANREGQYRNVSRATRRYAQALRDALDSGKRFRAVVVDITNVGTRWDRLRITMRPWTRTTPARGSRRGPRTRGIRFR